MIRVLCLLLGLWPAQMQAETVVSPSDFEELSTGKTLYFFHNGQFFGAEQYFPGRKSLWQYNGGECMEGEWFAQDALICFRYRKDPRVQCWHFLEKSSGFIARGENDPPELYLDLGGIDTQPLNCPGPDYGA